MTGGGSWCAIRSRAAALRAHPGHDDQNDPDDLNHSGHLREQDEADDQPERRFEGHQVYEAPWEGGDPLTAFNEDLAASPDVGKSVITVSGLPALAVEAHSPSDDEQANPAFLKLVVGSTEVQISGGESLQRLILSPSQ